MLAMASSPKNGVSLVSLFLESSHRAKRYAVMVSYGLLRSGRWHPSQ